MENIHLEMAVANLINANKTWVFLSSVFRYAFRPSLGEGFEPWEKLFFSLSSVISFCEFVMGIFVSLSLLSQRRCCPVWSVWEGMSFLQCDRCYNARDKTWRLKTHLLPASLGSDKPVEQIQVNLLPEDAWDVLETGPENIVLNILYMSKAFCKQDCM